MARPRVLLLLPTTSYKADDFLSAAERLGVDVVVGTDRRQALEGEAPDGTLALDFVHTERGLRRILDLHHRLPLAGVIGVDDETTVLAAAAGAALGLRANPVSAARASRDKHLLRQRLTAAGLRGPHYRRVRVDEDPVALAPSIDYPAVVKPIGLSASRGVLLVDRPAEFPSAFRRIAALLDEPDVRGRGGDVEHLLIEDYLPGSEVAVEGLLHDGRLEVLALFDKPEPMIGPTFAETIFVTPSRLPPHVRAAVEEETVRGTRALGLREGPIHAELRVENEVPWLLEIAARTIGGLCGRTLRFGAGISLEELVLRHAVGLPVRVERESQAAGVLMLPVTAAGTLRDWSGVEQARAVPGVEDVTISVRRGTELAPLPEGNRYLGFVFARAPRPEEVESALRTAWSHLHFDIE
jgi:biotin carboxylase